MSAPPLALNARIQCVDVASKRLKFAGSYLLTVPNTRSSKKNSFEGRAKVRSTSQLSARNARDARQQLKKAQELFRASETRQNQPLQVNNERAPQTSLKGVSACNGPFWTRLRCLHGDARPDAAAKAPPMRVSMRCSRRSLRSRCWC